MHAKKVTKVIVPALKGRGEFGRNYRLLFEFEGEKYKLLELAMRKDGSLVIAQMIPGSGNLRHKLLDVSRKGVKTLNNKDMESYDESELDNPGKMTFHMSGIINAEPKRLYRESLRTMTITQQLCAIIYPHTKTLHNPRGEREYDFTVRAPLAENAHLLVRVLISPADNVILDKFIDFGTVAVLELDFEGEQVEHATKKLIVHVLVDKMKPSNHPRASCVLIVTLRDRLVPKELLN
jgi:hypothetical protein